MGRITLANLDRGVEAGAASGFIIGIIVGIGAVIGFFYFYPGFLIEQQGINPIHAYAISFLLSILAVTLFPLAGIVLGSIVGMIFAAAYVWLPVKSPAIKGMVVSIAFCPILVFIALQRTPPTEQPLLASILTGGIWSMLSLIYGTSHGIFWKKLDAPGKETYLRRIVMRRLTYSRIAYMIIFYIIIIIVLALLIAPILPTLLILKAILNLKL